MVCGRNPSSVSELLNKIAFLSLREKSEHSASADMVSSIFQCKVLVYCGLYIVVEESRGWNCPCCCCDYT